MSENLKDLTISQLLVLYKDASTKTEDELTPAKTKKFGLLAESYLAEASRRDKIAADLHLHVIPVESNTKTVNGYDVETLLWLIATDWLYLFEYFPEGFEHSAWMPVINVNDIFAYAADAQNLDPGVEIQLKDVVSKFGYDGMIALVANQRGHEPLPQLQTDKYQEALVYVKETYPNESTKT